MTRFALAIALVTLLAPRAAHAGNGDDIVIDVPGERTTENWAVVGGLAGAGVIGGVIGLYFHLDTRSASNSLSSDKYTGHAWTADDQALVDQADRSKTRAIVGYSIGGALLIGAAVVYIVTEPRNEKAIIHPHGRGTPVVAPTAGGALLGGAWSF